MCDQFKTYPIPADQLVTYVSSHLCDGFGWLKDSFSFYIYAKSKIVEVVTVADHVNNSLLQVWKLRFVHKVKHLT